jgi:flavin-dependent dehydrogenase
MGGDPDVIVVGAGPAGSALATLLSREGVRVLLLERAAGPPAPVCGEYLSPGCLPMLDRLGVLEPLRAGGARALHGMRIHTAAGRLVEANYPAGASAGPACGLGVARALLDSLLLAGALREGVALEPWVQVCDLLWQDGRVVGVRGRRGGRSATYRASLVVGADGRNSVVARRIGRVRRHPWLDRMALVTHLSGVVRAEEVGEIFMARDGYAILNPLGPDLTNLGLVVDRRLIPRGEEPRRWMWRRAGLLPGLAERLVSARMLAPPRCLGPLAQRATRLAVPGALLIGDAAGFLDPFTGEGIHAALRSAELAALAIRADGAGARAETAAGYPAAWVREFAPKWRLSTWLQRVIRRPWLAEGVAAYLRRRPEAAASLMAAAGDLLPSETLALPRLLGRMLRGTADSHRLQAHPLA